jgi:hypothetical protein
VIEHFAAPIWLRVFVETLALPSKDTKGSLMTAMLHRYIGIAPVPGFQGRLSDPRRVHLPELLGLRGVAILIIVCGHLLPRIERFYGDASLTPFEKGVFDVLATPFTGCRLLFCISGYAFLVSLHNRSCSLDRFAVGTNIKNRLLWPPYFVVLAVTFLFLTITGYKPVGTTCRLHALLLDRCPCCRLSDAL